MRFINQTVTENTTFCWREILLVAAGTGGFVGTKDTAALKRARKNMYNSNGNLLL